MCELFFIVTTWEHPLEEKGEETLGAMFAQVDPFSMPVVLKLVYASESPEDI